MAESRSAAAERINSKSAGDCRSARGSGGGFCITVSEAALLRADGTFGCQRGTDSQHLGLLFRYKTVCRICWTAAQMQTVNYWGFLWSNIQHDVFVATSAGDSVPSEVGTVEIWFHINWSNGALVTADR